jgi:hypothetical protein
LDEAFIHHPFPVLGNEADDIITATIEDDNRITHEHLPVMALGDNRYKICCIPCFVYDTALGDIVLAENRKLMHVTESSGRHVFRIWFGNGWQGKFHILHEINARGGLVEMCTLGLIAIDVPDLETAMLMRAYLDDLETVGELEYETGWT